MNLQSRVALSLALVLCAASSAQATPLSIVVGQHNYAPGTGVVIIPIVVHGTSLVHGTDISVQLGGTQAAVAPFGSAPPITYEGSEQYNQPTPGAGSPVISPSMWDAHPNTWGDATFFIQPNDNTPTIPGTPGYGMPDREGTWFWGSLTFDSISTSTGTINPDNRIEVNLVVNLTGFGPGTWALRLLNGKAGATNFVDNTSGDPLPLTITDGAVTITPEPTSLVLGLFAAAGLALVAIRKRRGGR